MSLSCCKIPLLSVLCMFAPPSAAPEQRRWISWYQWALASVLRVRGHYRPAPVATSLMEILGGVLLPSLCFGCFFLGVLESALRGLWEALCRPGRKHRNKAGLSWQGSLRLWSPVFFFLRWREGGPKGILSGSKFTGSETTGIKGIILRQFQGHLSHTGNTTGMNNMI